MSAPNNNITQLPSRETINAMQVTNMLNTFTVLSGFLLSSRSLEQDDDSGGGARDGGVRCAAETTLIGVCAKLDAMLAEPGRFELKTQNTLEANLAEAYAMNSRMLAAQAEAYEEINSPHHRLKPALVKLGPGNWLAYSGDPKNLDNAICGMGEHPAQAIKAFDALFKGELPEHLKEWAAACEAATAAGQPVPEYSDFQNKKHNEKNTLANTRPPNIKNPPPKRNVRRRHRNENGPDDSGSGSKASD